MFSKRITQVRYSRYSREYVDPTFRKEDVSEPLAEDDIRRYRPIKAATNDQTSSLNYDPLVAKFIRVITREGKKDVAREIITKTFETIKLTQLEKWHNAKSEEERLLIELDAKAIFHEAVENCKPLLITQNVLRGGVRYTVPIPVPPVLQIHRAVNWIMEAANRKSDDTRIWETLAKELLLAAKNEGFAVRMKQDLHRVCEANRAYTHYRW